MPITNNLKKGRKPRKLLFVCTGNLFRSVIAQYCLDDYLKRNKITDLIVNSAGIIAKKDLINRVVVEEMFYYGMDVKDHKQKKLTKMDLENYDLIIAMAQNHIDFIEKNLGFSEAVLFNEVLGKGKKSVQDINEAIIDWKNHEKKSKNYMVRMIKYIYKNMPRFYKNLDSYFLFLDFMHCRRNQKYDFPFEPIYETKNTLAFMSISIPQKEDGHILVIPKKRYGSLENIPEEIVKELIISVRKIGKALQKTHGGYNVLLNNGFDAGQRVFHTHFHIIPRNKNDFITIELWKNKNLTRDKFLALNKEITQLVRNVI